MISSLLTPLIPEGWTLSGLYTIPHGWVAIICSAGNLVSASGDTIESALAAALIACEDPTKWQRLFSAEREPEEPNLLAKLGLTKPTNFRRRV